MALDPKLLEILACPEDKGPLLYFEDESALYNPRLKRRYAIRDDIPIMRPEEVRQLPERQALVVAENGKPIIAKLHRCVEGKAGERLLADQRALRSRLTTDRRMVVTPEARATAALVEARRLGFVDDEIDHARGDL